MLSGEYLSHFSSPQWNRNALTGAGRLHGYRNRWYNSGVGGGLSWVT